MMNHPSKLSKHKNNIANSFLHLSSIHIENLFI